ncbi:MULTISPECIES: YciI family protein [Streptomyces violaceusniger group]|uniref:YciI family protein n=2 Tax=Streptomyces javensis TaxID=114698 RepID=A0ABP4HWL6_9ACTN|nr:YciI family protein [Streptomyces javensis]MBI0312094.1 transcriptional regulator [Streptomyces javensis]
MPRYLSMIRVDEQNAPAEGPSPELMERMGELIEEMTKAGVMLDTAGLTPTSDGTRVTWSGGKISCTDGPFTESKEVIGGYALLQAKDKAEALEWTKRFLRVHEEFWTITVEVREVVEA